MASPVVIGHVADDLLHTSRAAASIGAGRQVTCTPRGAWSSPSNTRSIGQIDVLGGQRAAEILLVAVEQLVDGTVDVHLVKQRQAAAQVQAQRHGPQTDGAEECRRARSPHQRRDMRRSQVVVDRVAGRATALLESSNSTMTPTGVDERRLNATSCFLSTASTATRPASSMAARSLRATCSASSWPKKFGAARASANSATRATRMYFQRANSSIVIRRPCTCPWGPAA